MRVLYGRLLRDPRMLTLARLLIQVCRACAVRSVDGDEICDFKHIRADTTELWLVHLPPDVSRHDSVPNRSMQRASVPNCPELLYCVQDTT
jgi:hypothetical protein